MFHIINNNTCALLHYKQQPCHKVKNSILYLNLNGYRRNQDCHKNLRLTILSNSTLKNYKNVIDSRLNIKCEFYLAGKKDDFQRARNVGNQGIKTDDFSGFGCGGAAKKKFLCCFHNVFPDLFDIFSQTPKPIFRDFGGFLLKVELMYRRPVGQIGDF